VVLKDTICKGEGDRNVFSLSGFEGSQAVPARPTERGMFERGRSFRKRIGIKPEGTKLSWVLLHIIGINVYITLEGLNYSEILI
jgi:hypothetical protein